MWEEFDKKLGVCKTTFIWCLDLKKYKTYGKMNLPFHCNLLWTGLKKQKEKKKKTRKRRLNSVHIPAMIENSFQEASI